MEIMPNLSIKIGSCILKNPVGVASGTFGFGTEYEDLIQVSDLGALYTKAVTLLPRPGNGMPRIVETSSGMLNSIGLANPGLEAFVDKKLPVIAHLGTTIIVNVAGSTEDEYIKVVEKLEPYDDIHAYEINVSCPNVKHGGLAFGTDSVQIERLIKEIRKRTKKPIIVKLTPNVTDIASIAKASEAAGADAVSCINTLVGMKIDIQKKKPFLAMGTGGLSGPCILPVGVACVYKVAKAVKIPVIGLGGIMCSEDAIQYLLAGATGVQVGTGNFVDPRIPLQVLTGIQSYMKVQNFATISDFHNLF